LMPNKGSVTKNNGRMAQCMAQRIEVVIPSASQFIFGFIVYKSTKKATMLQIFRIL